MPPARTALDRGGPLAVAGIHLTEVPPLDYQRHLYRERQLRSVTANTREDGPSCRSLSGHHLTVAATPYPLDRAEDALSDLARDRVHRAAVLVP